MPVTHTTQQTSSETFFPITLLSISTHISQGVYQASADSILRNTHTSGYIVIMYQIYFINKLAMGYNLRLYFSVDGGWGKWSTWTYWTKTNESCGHYDVKYTRTRSRSCNYPYPSCGGNKCYGDSTQYESDCRKARKSRIHCLVVVVEIC